MHRLERRLGIAETSTAMGQQLGAAAEYAGPHHLRLHRSLGTRRPRLPLPCCERLHRSSRLGLSLPCCRSMTGAHRDSARCGLAGRRPAIAMMASPLEQSPPFWPVVNRFETRHGAALRSDHPRRDGVRRHRRAALHGRCRGAGRPHRRGRRPGRRPAPSGKWWRPARRWRPASSTRTRTTTAPCCAGRPACCARCRRASPRWWSATAGFPCRRCGCGRGRCRRWTWWATTADYVFDSFAAYADRLARDPAPVNTYALIGHMSLRVEAMAGDTQRAATDKEAAHMQARLKAALARGRLGLFHRALLPAQHDGADGRGDRRRRGAARRRAVSTSRTCATRPTTCCCRSRRPCGSAARLACRW